LSEVVSKVRASKNLHAKPGIPFYPVGP